MSYDDLPETTQVIYSELLELSIHAAAEEAGEIRPLGSFLRKQVKGKTYWYLQGSVGGERAQAYLGPDSESLRAWIDQVKQRRQDRRPDEETRDRLAAMLAAGGAAVVSPALAKILEVLADAGVFRWGGVLVGTHALGIYGNMLGISWQRSMLRTADLDIAQDPSVGVGLLAGRESPDIPEILRRSKLGLFPIPMLDRRQPSTSFRIRGQELRVDFLTPLVGPERNRPVFLPAFRLAAQPVRLLDYLIDEPVQALAISRRSSRLVNVPEPSRFALHKLWTSTRRAAAFENKAKKDRVQAAVLLHVLLEQRPLDVERAWASLEALPKVRRDIRRASAELQRHGLPTASFDQLAGILES